MVPSHARVASSVLSTSSLAITAFPRSPPAGPTCATMAESLATAASSSRSSPLPPSSSSPSPLSALSSPSAPAALDHFFLFFLLSSVTEAEAENPKAEPSLEAPAPSLSFPPLPPPPPFPPSTASSTAPASLRSAASTRSTGPITSLAALLPRPAAAAETHATTRAERARESTAALRLAPEVSKVAEAEEEEEEELEAATATATRMMRATCWVLTSARRAPTRGARNGLELLLVLRAAFELGADDEDEENSCLSTPPSALPRSPFTTETTCSVQRSDASLPALGATAAARGRDQASPAKAAAIVRARSHETSDLMFF